MKKFITTILLRRSYRKAVKSAQHLSRMYHKKYVVILWKGKFKPVSKSLLKTMYTAGAFKKGLNFRQIQKMAIYSTH